MKQYCLLITFFAVTTVFSQHNNEFYNDGALVYIQPGAEVHVWGDVHMAQLTGDLQNNGLLKVQGNMYSDGLFRQRGTGTTRIENSDVNIGERQFISGSYAVRSVGSTAKGTAADGSFYNLELVNDLGMVYLVNTIGGFFDKYVADVRNSVHYNLGTQMNRLITSDIGMTGAITYPANGSAYPAIFGMMNPTSPMGGAQGWRQNTVQMNGNMSSTDWGYVQGKMRQQIDAITGRQYQFVVGVEPGGAGQQMGMQYARIDFAAGADYDVLESYYERGLPNAFTSAFECSGAWMNYFGGVDHGQWVIDNPAGGSTPYTMNVWPQDDNFQPGTVWMITKDNGISGTANDCGPSPVGLSRSGFSGFSTFGVASAVILLPVELIDINATGVIDHIDVAWTIGSESNVSHYELERSEDGVNFDYITSINGVGTTSLTQYYDYSDFDVRYFQDFYYRVKSVDMDGDYDYTPIVVANIKNANGGFSEGVVSIYPNPSSEDFNISIYSDQERDLSMKVYNSLGQVIQEQTSSIKEGNTVMSIASSEWSSGVYHIALQDLVSGEIINKKFIKK